MAAGNWVWITNLLLDLIGFFLRAASWLFFVWYPIAAVPIVLKMGSPAYVIPIAIAFCVAFGFVCRWFSDGIYKRKPGRMLTLACGCLLMVLVSVISIAILHFLSASSQSFSATSVIFQCVLWLFIATVLILGVVRRKVLAEKPS